ncbi:efflux RND transporter periplasmic adaptor subunit [Paenibacillus sp. XY044]|uniref:efflux RND transporter periplasmic adaptor subunit n=1 Tax=Paenibacillus sp. XY044 TaxID=2026089 RepID=UPI0015C623B0|nr:efflux RND transporter periplasmic adaptor subunit [Paenibacillus sp. XY044]
MGIEQARRKKSIAWIAGIFILLLILFTLFSNTLAALTLPKVAVASVGRGDLSHEYHGTGVLEWKEETELSGTSGWKVKEVKVKAGDTVKKGQTLVTYDGKEVQQQILDEQGTLAKLKMSAGSLKYALMEAMQGGDEKTINDATNAYKSSGIDMDTQERRIQVLQDSLNEGGKLVAPFSGTVTKVNAKVGFAAAGAPDVVLSDHSQGLGLELSLPAQAVTDLKTGSEIDLQLDGESAAQVKGRIESIADSDAVNANSGNGGGDTGNAGNAIVQMKKLSIAVQDPAAKNGTTVQVDLTQSLKDVVLVPNEAVHDENGKKYVFGIEPKEGPLGNAFYVRKEYITVVDSNETQSAVTDGIFDQEQIIMESSKPLQEGDRIRM